MPPMGAGTPGKALVDDGLRKADGVEEMCAAIAVDDADAHLRHDLGEAEFEGVEQVFFAVLGIADSRAVSSASHGQTAPAPMPSSTAT